MTLRDCKKRSSPCLRLALALFSSVNHSRIRVLFVDVYPAHPLTRSRCPNGLRRRVPHSALPVPRRQPFYGTPSGG